MSVPTTKIVSIDQITPEAWNSIASSDLCSPKLLYDWTRCIAAVYNTHGALRVIVAGPLSNPTAVLPLSISQGILRRHRFVANDDGGLPVLCRDDSVLPGLVEALIGLRVPVDLGYYPVEHPLVEEIQRAASGRAVVILRRQEKKAAPWLELDPSWQDPGRYLKRKMRRSIQRNLRRVAEQGEMRIDFLEPAEHEVDEVLDTYVQLETKGWKHRAGTGLFQDVPQQAFLRLYFKVVAKKGLMHVALLSLNGRPMAMSLGEIYDNTYWAYKTSFDEEFAKFGPGVLMDYNLVAHLAAREVSRIEFQGQLDSYKQSWTQNALETVALRIYPFNFHGTAAAVYDFVKQSRKRHFKGKVAEAKR